MTYGGEKCLLVSANVTKVGMRNNETNTEVENDAASGVLVGRYDHALDPKKRLTIPSEWRAALGRPKYIYVFPDPNEECLDLIPSKEMESRVEKLRREALFNPEIGKVLQAIGEFAEQLEFDVQGRIRIGDKLLKYAGLSGQVAMVGAINRARLWNPDKLAPSDKVDPAKFRQALSKYMI